MPGAWELTTKPFLVFGILHTWEIHPDFVASFTALRKRGLVHYEWQHDKPWDFGRNVVAKACLDDGAEWCFFLDSDVLPPANALLQLLSHNLPIVGGLYYRRHPEVFPVAFHLRDEVQFEPMKQEEIRPGLQEVDGVGGGCLLVHRRVFESLKDDVPKLRPGLNLPESNFFYEFFKWSVFEKPWASEDLYFQWLARKRGWKIFLDASVSCGHVLSSMMVRDNQTQWTPLERGVPLS